MARVRWGVLSTAGIGRLVIEASRPAAHAEVVAVASRDAALARAFADELGLEASFGSYEELLASGDVDAVYVPLPVSMHTEWTVKALEAGKHVLCEKPFATSAADAARCFDAAERAGRRCVEGLMWRHHPQTTLARKLVADGTIGRLAHVRAALSVSVEPGDIRRSVELGGGALGDLGCDCVSAIRLFAGEPWRVHADQVRDGASGVDLRLAATLRMPGDVLAQFDVGLDLARRDELELVGTEGMLTIPDPWLCRSPHLELSRDGHHELVPVDPDGTLGLTDPDHDVYRIELDSVSAVLAGGAEPAFGRADAVAHAIVLEALHRSTEQGAPVDLPAARMSDRSSALAAEAAALESDPADRDEMRAVAEFMGVLDDE
jgi:D-xylose 1-dehydrogenase (NADP+, D-xylono-1,5-lactone-forming)